MGSPTSRCSRLRPLKHLTWLAALLTASPLLVAAAPGKTSGCLIEPEQVADVGSPVTGVIETLSVQLGDVVSAGQALVTLRSDVERANAQVAALRSSVDAEARAAQANVELAQQKVIRQRQLLTQGFVSDQALEQAITEAEVARQRHKLALSQQQIYREEQAVARAQVGLRTLRSPIHGVVVERYSNLGERVEDRPVVRIASINPLRVSLMMPMAQFGQIGLGDVMSVKPELPGAQAVRATVQYVDKVVDAASNTFRVRLVLPNPDLRLPGGLRCKADLLSKAAARPPTASPAVSSSVTPRSTHMAPPSAKADQVRSPRMPRQVARTEIARAELQLKTSWTLTRVGTATTPLAPTASAPPGSAPWLTASLTLQTRR
ncbi:MAG TPA: efflux RND transporter periplasmic adaptor subunit [Aquabacterium sp.]|uniref:efflux RND transporter periplasmic adaptor subunit n=1 Tax=Aquabacterium sp. TaxID=1872578 RepID=UPI002E3351BF|nr:efflux RND transporter periplasmic adaptor subunit [Aquabacterium sp.]HEX5373166.1 efflux RND transporter periplasmic adaptor subunit [Aquabacterium sp.]